VGTSAFQLNFKLVNTNSKISRSISDFFSSNKRPCRGSNRAVHSLRSTSDLSKSSLYSTTLWPRGGGDSRVCMQTQLTILVGFSFAESAILAMSLSPGNRITGSYTNLTNDPKNYGLIAEELVMCPR
jgi:hypothetical protein